MTAAVPVATPKSTDSLDDLPRARLRTMPATMLSPAPTLLIMGTVGGRMCSLKSLDTARAPAAPSEITSISQRPLSTSSRAAASICACSLTSLPTRSLNSRTLGLIRNTPSSRAASRARPETSTMVFAPLCLPTRATRA